MFCPNCGKKSNARFCMNCGAKMPDSAPAQQVQQPAIPPVQQPMFQAQPMQYAVPPKKSSAGWIIAAVIGGIILFAIVVNALSRGGGPDSASSVPQGGNTSAVSTEEGDSPPVETETSAEPETPAETEAPTETEAPKVDDDTISFDQSFEFDGLEITISSDIKWVKLDNMLSEFDGQDVAEIPITITNNGSETNGLTFLSFKQFAPDGNELDSIWLFFNNDVFSAGDIRVGATQNTYLHLLYKGDGDYVIEFSEFFGETIEVVLPIKK